MKITVHCNECGTPVEAEWRVVGVEHEFDRERTAGGIRITLPGRTFWSITASAVHECDES